MGEGGRVMGEGKGGRGVRAGGGREVEREGWGKGEGAFPFAYGGLWFMQPINCTIMLILSCLFVCSTPGGNTIMFCLVCLSVVLLEATPSVQLSTHVL